MSTDGLSLLTPLGYQHSSCGYCKGTESSPSYYCHGYRSMRPRDYESLVNRMWRRSGTTYYKPDTKNACCPHYTIRLDASQFQVNRSQKKTSNKFTSWILGEDYRRKAAQLFPKSRDDKKKRRESFVVEDRVHEPEWRLLPRQDATGKLASVEPAHRFEVTLESDTFTEEKYTLFELYQREVHKEPPSKISKAGFKGFLCSGLSMETYEEDARPRPLGSYHQCYRIDGKLVAIGVLDLLPHCVSSVYLIYHPEFAQWEFGKLSALREIAMAREEGYGYYYMGYYIHSCVKMRYKRSFKPTYILDPESYDWNLFDDALVSRFEHRKHISLAQERRLGLKPTDRDPEAPESKASSSGGDGSIFLCGMTGLVQPADIIRAIPLQNLPFYYKGNIVSVPSLTWDETEMLQPFTLQGRLAEFVACIGVEGLSDGSIAAHGVLPSLDWLKEDDDEGGKE